VRRTCFGARAPAGGAVAAGEAYHVRRTKKNAPSAEARGVFASNENSQKVNLKPAPLPERVAPMPVIGWKASLVEGESFG
jgi:hypothetical protein